MSFNFLPDKQQPQPKPNTSSGFGSVFNVGKSYFFDQYENHFDIQNLITFPITRDQFILTQNFNLSKNIIFSESTIKSGIRQNWYGQNTEFDKLINGYTSFQKPDVLSDTIKKLNSEITNDLFAGIEKPKLKINDRFGMFSFDLASMAMNYVYEYYTKAGEKVDANFIKKSGTDFVYTVTNEIVEQKIKKHENGNPVVISSVRNSLIDFEKKEKENRAVEIFILNSVGANVSVENFIWNAMAGVAVAENLILKGFKVKLTGVFTVKDRESNVYFHFVPVKNFNQPLDINAAAYVCGDTRFFRFQAFKMYIKGYDQLNFVCPDTIGTPINDMTFVSNEIETKYILNSQRKQGDTRLYFGGSRNLDQVKAEVEKAIKILQQKYGNDSKN
jgi:hypothetical protein